MIFFIILIIIVIITLVVSPSIEYLNKPKKIEIFYTCPICKTKFKLKEAHYLERSSQIVILCPKCAKIVRINRNDFIKNCVKEEVE